MQHVRDEYAPTLQAGAGLILPYADFDTVAWPFEGLRIACPGRDIPWDDYNALPEQSVAALIERARDARA